MLTVMVIHETGAAVAALTTRVPKLVVSNPSVRDVLTDWSGEIVNEVGRRDADGPAGTDATRFIDFQGENAGGRSGGVGIDERCQIGICDECRELTAREFLGDFILGKSTSGDRGKTENRDSRAAHKRFGVNNVMCTP